MNNFEKEIKKEAKKIIENLDFEAIKINKIGKNEASILLKDKNSNFKCWFDLWGQMEEITGDWNKYIFDLNNSKDLLQKYIQENSFVFDLAISESIRFLEKNI